MKAHHGMRPQDIVILLKMITIPDSDWQYRDLASGLYISISEVSESFQRSRIAGLVDDTRRHMHRQAILEFIKYGLHYVFPQIPGTLVTGTPTGHSHPYFAVRFSSEVAYVWPDHDGTIRGLSITPLHKGVPQAVKKDAQLYKLLACIDVIRVGQVREKKLAITELKHSLTP